MAPFAEMPDALNVRRSSGTSGAAGERKRFTPINPAARMIRTITPEKMRRGPRDRMGAAFTLYWALSLKNITLGAVIASAWTIRTSVALYRLMGAAAGFSSAIRKVTGVQVARFVLDRMV